MIEFKIFGIIIGSSQSTLSCFIKAPKNIFKGAFSFSLNDSPYLSEMLRKAKIFWKFNLIISLSILLWNCGQKGSPTGGNKDNIPPQIVESNPHSFDVNFNGKKISWKFDEYVTLSSLNQELLISPPVKKQPTYKLSGKKLTLTFDTLLQPNTTYSIFLGKGIKDLNEGNPLQDNLLIFSTGKFIDSLSFHGDIYDAESMKKLSEGMVHLYKDVKDSTPLKKIPSYFAKIQNGHFHFTNLAEGRYKVFYLNDNNSNFLYDLPNESIAFLNTPINISEEKDTSKIVLRAFSGEDKRQFLTGSSCSFRGKFDFEFNLPVQKFSINILNKNFKKDWKILDWNKTKDSLTVWSSNLESLDSVTLVINFDGIKDTLHYQLSNRKEMKSQSLSTHNNFEKIGDYYKKPFHFTFSQPISSYDTSKIILVESRDTIFAPISCIEKSLKKFQLNFELKENSKYTLFILPNAVQSIFGENNKDTLQHNFTTASNSSLGNLTIDYNFIGATNNGILQVYFEENFMKEVLIEKNQGKLILEGAKAGNYKLKYILDENNDKKWTTGNYLKKEQPEKVYWYNQSITLRANWDLDVEWLLNLEKSNYFKNRTLKQSGKK
ncbi:MAG: hypothetical protein CMP67_07960 [Flavobacteriales bacterium]|nr:hypothetical protein [Flavobacteriales bacterium]|tara:strand:- start:5196 stop:7007 length:1812 start_codon:yes stop_codon:yes gene_type:complete